MNIPGKPPSRRQYVAVLCWLTLLLAAGAAWTQIAQQAAAAPADTPQERFDSLSLNGSDLRAMPPQVGETVVLPTFSRELLRVQWRFQDPIDLYVIKPRGVARPPVVIFLYSYPTDTDRFLNDALCESLTRNGFAAVAFVSALTGQRYHDRPMKEWFVSELQESLVTSVHDVQMVLNYLQTRGDLDMGRVGIFGQGSGGTIAILSAAVDPRLKAVDILDPWGDWPDWLAKSPRVPENERANFLTPEFLSKVAPIDPVQWLPQLKDRPLRLEETLFTSTVPDAARKHIRDALPAGAVVIQYADKSDYIKEAAANGKILDWLDKALTTP